MNPGLTQSDNKNALSRGYIAGMRISIKLLVLTNVMNPRTMKILSLVLIAIGAIMIIFPSRVEMHIYPEQVQLWEDSLEIGEPLQEHGWVKFDFVTGELSLDEGIDHILYVTNSESSMMNVTLWIIEDDDSLNKVGNYTDDRIWFFPPISTSIRFLINGSAYIDDVVTLDIGIMYLRPVPSEYFWEFPYRFPGIGVVVVGLVVYVFLRQRQDQIP